MDWLGEGLWILQWILVLLILHLSLWTAIRRWIPVHAYPVSYPASVLLFGLLSWGLALVSLPVWPAVLPFLALPLLSLRADSPLRSELRAGLKWECIFLGFFGAMVITRMKNSAAFGGESLLDMGIISSIMRAPVVPPLDPQYAGGLLDIYYYFSHWIYATLGLVAHLPPPVVYNLVLPTTLGLAALCCYAMGEVIIPRLPFLPLLLLLLPRPSLMYVYLTGAPADFTTALEKSVLVIPGVGSNYPWYDLLWGIPHPHVNGLLVQVFLLYTLLLLVLTGDEIPRAGKRFLLATAGIAAGVMILVNSWDTFVYYPLLAGVFILLIRRVSLQSPPGDTAGFLRSPDGISMLLLPASALLTAGMLWSTMDPRGVNGWGLVSTPSDLIPFLAVHGLFLVLIYAFLAGDIRIRPYILLTGLPAALAGYWSAAILLPALVTLLIRKDRVWYDCLAAYALLVLLLTELVYLREPAALESRYNTVFKCSLALLPVIWISVSGMIGSWLSAHPSPSLPGRDRGFLISGLVCTLLCLAFVLAPVEPYFPVLSIDAAAFLEEEQPGDAAIIRLLSADRNATVLIEAAGDFDYHGRIAAFTGIPSVIGWPSVEQQWGREPAEVQERARAVEKGYRDTDGLRHLIARYHPTHLVAGPLEGIKYGIFREDPDLLSLVAVRNTTRLYEVLA